MASLTTRTGSFPIGFFVQQLTWKQDLLAVGRWAQANGFGFIDLGSDADRTAQALTDAGCRIGSVDLPLCEQLLSADEARRQAAVEQVSAYIDAAAAAGAGLFEVCAVPEDAGRPRAENLELAVRSFRELAVAFERTGTKLAIEGWPGKGAVATTPESYRALLEGCASPAIGINYDPSHLIRMGIDPVRFAAEFARQVYHCHGKDTELDAERLYQLGTEQAPVAAEQRRFGGGHWRYTIPGHGQMRWTAALEILAAAGYQGGVSIELEDANFNGSESGEQAGLRAAGAYLASV